MQGPVASSGRAITIDRPRRRRIARDVVLQLIGTGWGQRRLLILGLVMLLVGLRFSDWPVAALLLALGWSTTIGWWWLKARRSLRAGLDVGQTVRVDHAASGDVSITDSTGQVWLSRGSVLAVVPFRGNVTVVGRQIVFLLPRELLTPEDIAFLEGHGPSPYEGTATPVEPRLSCEITADIQAGLVAAATTVVARSADFLMPWVASIFVLGVVCGVGSTPAVAVAAALGALAVLPGVQALQRTRARMRTTYPVGLVVRADVTPDSLWLALGHVTRTIGWRELRRVRVTRNAVLLGRKRRLFAADTTLVLPIQLFDADAVQTIVAAVGGRP